MMGATGLTCRAWPTARGARGLATSRAAQAQGRAAGAAGRGVVARGLAAAPPADVVAAALLEDELAQPLAQAVARFVRAFERALDEDDAAVAVGEGVPAERGLEGEVGAGGGAA